MATGKLDEDLDLGIEKGKGSKNKLIVIIAAAALLLFGGGLAVTWFLLDGSDQQVASDQEQETDAEQQPKSPAIYYPLDPLFVVNLPPGSKAKLLQVGIQVMTRQQELVDFVQHNDPMIRHSLLNLLGSQDDDTLLSRKGKEKLQSEVVKSMNKIVRNQGGPGEVEAVYFTSFVMQ